MNTYLCTFSSDDNRNPVSNFSIIEFGAAKQTKHDTEQKR